MTFDDKITLINSTNQKIKEIEKVLRDCRLSRAKKDKTHDDDNYPIGLAVDVMVCTGSQSSRSNNYGNMQITDKALLASLFSVIEPVLEANLCARKAELENLLK